MTRVRSRLPANLARQRELEADVAIARLRRLAALLGAVVAAGTAMYMALEGWPFLDALYMTVITLATVGYMEVHPLGDATRVGTILLILLGFGTMLVFFVALTEYLVSGALAGTLRRRRMQREIDLLSGHMVVCGYGRVGQHVVDDLLQKGERVVVVEERELPLSQLSDRQHLVIGDATDDAVLQRAGVARAKGLVAATGDDTVNIVVTLTARAMRPDLVIVARADQAGAEAKLRRAGATHTISLYRIAGHRIAAQLRNPRVTDFLDLVMHSGDLELWIEDLPVAAGSPLRGRSLGEVDVRGRTGVNLLAVSRPGRPAVPNPDPSYVLDEGDELIAIGTRAQLEQLAALAGATALPGSPAAR
ncbi:MAG: potassium channel protein [Gemmatimonadales bacterium]|nr:potassium channel protein [Gemmatimonadales bacterium]